MNLIPSRARYSVARSVSRPGQTQRARPRSCAHAVSLACYTALYLFISGGSVMPQNGTSAHGRACQKHVRNLYYDGPRVVPRARAVGARRRRKRQALMVRRPAPATGAAAPYRRRAAAPPPSAFNPCANRAIELRSAFGALLRVCALRSCDTDLPTTDPSRSTAHSQSTSRVPPRPRPYPSSPTLVTCS